MEERIINIAVLNDGWQFMYGNGNFDKILDKYSWQINNKKFEFDVKLIKHDDVLNDKIRNFDAILVGAVDEYINLYRLKLLGKTDEYLKWIKNIQNFIKNGGGYGGHCGGANLICELYNEPETFLERAIKAVNFGIVETRTYQKISIPVLDQIIGLPPTAQEGAAYMNYDGFGPNVPQMGGIPLDFIVKDRNHPILKGYSRETIKIFWGGGPGLIPGNKAKVLLSYPKEELSSLYPLHIWEYVGVGKGGRVGMIVGLIKSILWEAIEEIEMRRLLAKSLRKISLKKLTMEEFIKRIYERARDEKEAKIILKILKDGLLKAKDWRRLDQIMPVKRANMAAMVEEIYGDGRIIISGPHPEDKIWDNGKIVDVEDTKENCLWEGFMRWKDYKDLNRENAWLLRREAAWVAGLDEDELPPIPEEYLEKEAIPTKPVKIEERKETIIEALIRFFRRFFRK